MNNNQPTNVGRHLKRACVVMLCLDTGSKCYCYLGRIQELKFHLQFDLLYSSSNINFDWYMMQKISTETRNSIMY